MYFLYFLLAQHVGQRLLPFGTVHLVTPPFLTENFLVIELDGVDTLVLLKQALDNVKGLLESQNLDFSHVVKTTVFLDDMKDFNTVNSIYAQYFVEPYPARSAIEVGSLPKGALIEVEIIAVK